ncbi:hypothetical protein BJP40_19245 [Streptomyces sp. CC53]|nr:hypothetical protein BJP40_19245 [Streptomyces sp. CC53]
MERTIRRGVPATGGIAASFTQDLLGMPDDAEVVAVASRTLEGAKGFAERFGPPCDADRAVCRPGPVTAAGQPVPVARWAPAARRPR